MSCVVWSRHLAQPPLSMKKTLPQSKKCTLSTSLHVAHNHLQQACCMTKLLLLLQVYIIPIIIGDCVSTREDAGYSATALPTTLKTKTAEVTEEYVYK